MTEQEVKHILGDIEIFYLELTDHSWYHKGHIGNVKQGDHYQLILVSDDFKGLGQIQRHRLIYNKFSPLLGSKIHALSLKLLTIDGWHEHRTVQIGAS